MCDPDPPLCLQPTLYHSFAQEVAYLDAYFAGLGSSSHVLGHPADGLQWHVYVAGTACAQQPTCSLEICMTQLDAVKAQQFFRSAHRSWAASHTHHLVSQALHALPDPSLCTAGVTPMSNSTARSSWQLVRAACTVMGGLLQCENMHQYWDLLTPACRCSSFRVSAEQTTKGCGMCSSMPQYLTPPYSCRCSSYVSAEQTTEASGIRSLVPLAAIDDYVFEPCGYSMNSQEGRTFSTIHITPEAGFSYASFEISCFAAGSVDVQHLVARLSELFIPGEHLVCGVVCCAVLCLLSFFCN